MEERSYNTELIDDLKEVAQDVLKIRDDIGAVKAHVYFLTRETDPNTGEVLKDTWKQILPTPNIRDFGHDIKLVEAGAVKQSDLLLTSIPISKYREEDLVTDTENQETQLFFVVQQKAYTTVHIKRNYLTFNVLIRRFEAINEGELIPFKEDE